MKSFKYSFLMFALASSTVLFTTSCDKEKDEEEEAPEMEFKSGGSYIASDASVAPGDQVVIGIEAEVREAKDPIVKFNISKTVNGGSQQSIYNEDLSNNSFEYDYTFTVDSAQSGNTEKYTFTVTNRDGLTGQKSLTLVID